MGVHAVPAALRLVAVDDAGGEADQHHAKKDKAKKPEAAKAPMTKTPVKQAQAEKEKPAKAKTAAKTVHPKDHVAAQTKPKPTERSNLAGVSALVRVT